MVLGKPNCALLYLKISGSIIRKKILQKSKIPNYLIDKSVEKLLLNTEEYFD